MAEALDHVSELAAAMSGFADFAEQVTGDEPVPACAEWSARDLVVHLGAVHRWAAGIVIGGQRIKEPSASDLYLALWHRIPRGGLSFDGDDGVALLDGPTTP